MSGFYDNPPVKFMPLKTDHLLNCIQTLESALERLQKAVPGSIDYEVFRNATIKGFELTLETSGKLLRKTLKLYTPNPRQIDELVFKDLLREATKHALLAPEEVQRWFHYRDNRNTLAHDYGVEFVEETMKIIPNFIRDARQLQKTLQAKLG